jgi:hypothetical protein
MKALILTLLASTLFAVSSCRKSCEPVIPSCIQSEIDANKNNSEWGVESIDEYEYQGGLVYVRNYESSYSDMHVAVIKSDCSSLCFLGGITGNQMCNGDKFSEKARFTRKVWQK